MKRLTAIIAVFLLMVGSVQAQSEDSQLRVYGAAGASVYSGPAEYADVWDPGVNLGGGLGLAMTPDLEVMLTGTYSRFAINESGIIADTDADFSDYDIAIQGGRNEILALMADLKYTLRPGGAFRPYVLGGAGVHRVQIEDLVVAFSDGSEVIEDEQEGHDSTALGVHIGLGATYPITPTLSMLGELRFAHLFADGGGVQYLPARVGLALAL